MKPFSVDRISVRRFLLDSQFLLSDSSAAVSDAGTPQAALQILHTLECVQLDPVSAVERNQHLVLAARNPNYRPAHLDQLLSENKVFEYIANAACAIPMEDYPIFQPIRDHYRLRLQAALEQVSSVVPLVLNRLQQEGPLPSRAFQSTKRVHGYWDNAAPKTKETSLALNLLLDVGIIRVVKREGTERFFDLTEKTIDEELLCKADTIETAAAKQALIDKYIRAYRVFDAQDPRFGWHKMTASERRAEIERRVQAGDAVQLQIEEVERPYFILAENLDRLQQFASMTKKDRTPADGPVRFLPPLDNLLWRRERIVDLFDFNYKWEIYIPETKRRYGYYAMPILCGDRLIGRLDPRLDRKGDRLLVRLLQLENGVRLTPQLKKRIREALETFAQFHQVQHISIERTEPAGLTV